VAIQKKLERPLLLEVDIDNILIQEDHVPSSGTSYDGYNYVSLDTLTDEIEYEPVVWSSIKAGVVCIS